MKHAPREEQAGFSDHSMLTLDSATLTRIIEEVRQERTDGAMVRCYDRTHNRHNR